MPEPISTSSGSAGKTISKSFSLQPKCTLSFDNETAGSLSDALSHCWYNLSITSLAWASSGLPGHYSEYSQDLGPLGLAVGWTQIDHFTRGYWEAMYGLKIYCLSIIGNLAVWSGATKIQKWLSATKQ